MECRTNRPDETTSLSYFGTVLCSRWKTFVPALPASADIFLGVPFNIASYALLTLMMAQVCDLQPGDFVHTLGDAHIYLNHIEQVKLQLTREPYLLPFMKINPEVKNILISNMPDFELVGYQAHPHIPGIVCSLEHQN